MQVKAKTEAKATRKEVVEYFGNYYIKDDLSKPVGFTFGTLLWLLSFPILWFNERRNVKIDSLFLSGLKLCKEIESIENPQESHNFELVYVSGETKNQAKVRDDELGFEYPNCVKLIRTVHMYQWVEHVKKTK